MKSEPQEIKASEPSPTILEEKNEPIVSVIKTEHIELSDNEDEDKKSDVVESISPTLNKQYDKMDAEIMKKTILGDASSLSMNSLNVGGTDTKYCHVCDIKFNYLNTFIAHKKFYCKSIQSDLDASGATTNQATAVIATARSSPNQTSVVT